jgi:hypothetical protein
MGIAVEVLHEEVAGLAIGKATLTVCVCAHARAARWAAVGDAHVLDGDPLAAGPCAIGCSSAA